MASRKAVSTIEKEVKEKTTRKTTKKVVEQIDKVKGQLQSILDDEQMYFDNMPENLQSSMRASDSEEAIGNMEDVIEKMDEIIENLNELL